jgi:hypothetical protein
VEERKMKIKKEVITRRDFLGGTAAAALSLTVLPDWLKAGMVKKETKSSADQKSLVLVVRDEHVLDSSGNKVDKKILGGMISQVMTALTGEREMKKAWLKLFSPKDVVGLVPTSLMNPTHNELIEFIKESLVAAGLPEDNIRLAQGRSVDLNSITALISLPGLKAHWLTGIGTVIKNYILYSGAPRNYHYEDSTKLGEIWHLPQVKGKTRLIIVDALRPVCDRGPQFDPRYRWPYKGLLAGTDPVALDAVGLKIIQTKRDELRGEHWPISPPPISIEAADKIYKLGNSRLENIEINTIGWTQELLL